MIQGILIATFIVPLVLNILTKSNTSSITSFSMRPPRESAVIGAVLVIFIGGMLWLSIRIGQFNNLIALMAALLLTLGVFLMLLPVKGFWEVSVNNDKITSSRLWVIRKSINIGDIDHCNIHKNGILICAKDGSMIAVEKMFTNVSNFKKRIKKENIRTLEQGDWHTD